MNELHRREFLRMAAILTTARVLGIKPVFAQSVSYGITKDQTPARRNPSPSERPFESYRTGTLLRYTRLPEAQSWLTIHHDSKGQRSRRRPSRLIDNIFVESDFIDELIADEISPLNTDVPADQKEIEIILTRPQRLIARQSGQPVLEVPVSAGLRRGWTPTGEHRIRTKRWARYMLGSDYDLPGVPFTQYFNLNKGIAIHGTYWHNDFGNPRSHGCVNVPNEQALWLFRWTNPTLTDFGVEELRQDGTRVSIHY